MTKKVVIIGPESTGKSTLCAQLALHYKTIWCQEYAREYLNKNGAAYTYDDLLKIAKGQIHLEEKTTEIANSSRQPIVFIDTDMYVMKVWCEYVFSKCHQFILNEIANRKYDLYLLCNNDLPWVADDLREYPDEESRKELLNIYRDIMIHQNAPWETISGNENERLQNAIAMINKHLNLSSIH